MFASSESRTPVARKEVDDHLVAPASTYVRTVLETCGQGRGRTADLPLFRIAGHRVFFAADEEAASLSCHSRATSRRVPGVIRSGRSHLSAGATDRSGS